MCMLDTDIIEALLGVVGIRDIKAKNGIQDIRGKNLWDMGYLKQISRDIESENC